MEEHNFCNTHRKMAMGINGPQCNSMGLKPNLTREGFTIHIRGSPPLGSRTCLQAPLAASRHGANPHTGQFFPEKVTKKKKGILIV